MNPAVGLGIVRPMLAALFGILGLIGLTSLFTASAVGLRDHLRDIGALRAMGLTPAQVMASLVTRMSVLALIAATGGAAIGLSLSSRLINLTAQAYGIGAGLASPPPTDATLTAAAAAIIAAAITALIPGASRVRDTNHRDAKPLVFPETLGGWSFGGGWGLRPGCASAASSRPR